jgi:hypothetical protein
MVWRRVPFLLPAGVALLLGVDAGLSLLGVPSVTLSERLADVHGPLLVFGFVGALVALERAVALRRRTGYAAPLLLGVGGLLLLAPVPLWLGQAMLVAGSAAFTVVYLALWRRTRDEAVVVQALGAVVATGAAILWLGGMPVPRLLPWLAGFVVLTIAGERLELARLELAGTECLELAGAEGLMLAAAGALVVAIPAALLWPVVGYPLLGLSLLLLVGWLVSHDAARRTVHSTGLPRFVAWCLLAGYAWLAVASAIWLLRGPVVEGLGYDALVHAVFLGFTMSMIMAHAPVILPAVLRVRLPYHPVMYLPAALLHSSLVLRVAVGDARGLQAARDLGGILNAVAVLLFLGTLVWSATRARSSATTRASSSAGYRASASAAPRPDATASPRADSPSPTSSTLPTSAGHAPVVGSDETAVAR